VFYLIDCVFLYIVMHPVGY